MDLRLNIPTPKADTPATAKPSTPDVRGDTLNRIGRSLVASRLKLAGDTAGRDPYDSRRAREPGSVWGHRRR